MTCFGLLCFSPCHTDTLLRSQFNQNSQYVKDKHLYRSCVWLKQAEITLLSLDPSSLFSLLICFRNDVKCISWNVPEGKFCIIFFFSFLLTTDISLAVLCLCMLRLYVFCLALQFSMNCPDHCGFGIPGIHPHFKK